MDMGGREMRAMTLTPAQIETKVRTHMRSQGFTDGKLCRAPRHSDNRDYMESYRQGLRKGDD